MNYQFRKGKPIKTSAMHPTPAEAEARLSKHKKAREKKQTLGKQHADNQSELDTNHRGERERKRKKLEEKKKQL